MPVALSVIIPAYSPRAEFADLLVAVSQQIVVGTFEVIVVNDGSPPDESSFIDRCVKEANQRIDQNLVKLIQLGKNSGPARARNVGVSKSKGENLFFLDSDCQILSPNLLRDVLNILNQRSGMIVGGVVDGRGQGYIGFSDHYCHWITNLPGYEGYAPEPHIVSTNMTMSKETWDRVGPFSEELRSGEDVDLCFRAKELGIKLWLTDTMRVGHYDRTRFKDYFVNYFLCGSYRPLFYGRFSKRRRFLTGGPRWMRIMLIPLIFSGLTLRYVFRWAPIDKKIFLAIGGIMLASFAMALGNALGPLKNR
jgi:GT2 family glycosyltransferase